MLNKLRKHSGIKDDRNEVNAQVSKFIVRLAWHNSDLLTYLLYDFRKPDVLHDVFMFVLNTK